MLQATGFLTTGDHWWIDVARVVAIVTGVLVIALALMLALRPGQASLPGDDKWAKGAAAWGTFAVIQESTQIGHPFVIWRLPLLLIGNIYILAGIAERARAGRHL